MDLIESRNKTNTQRHPWEMARIEVVEKLIRKHYKNSDTITTILDVGCGDVFFASELSKSIPGADIYAVDTAFTREHLEAINKSDTRVRAYSTLEEAALHIKKPADVVLMLDVIEHIEKDIPFLKYVLEKEVISSETLFVISVPAFQKLFCSHDVFLGHYRRYTNKSLNDAIEKAGLEKIETGYFFFSLLPLRVIQVLKEKIFKHSKSTTGLVEWQGGNVKTGMVKNMLTLDFALTNFFKRIGINIVGLSNYTLCRKKPL
jgi:hypothetical protein